VAVAAFLVFAAGASSGSARGAPAADKPAEAVAGELIVGFRGAVGDFDQEKVLDASGAKTKRKFARINAKLVSIDPAKLKKAIAKLEDDPRVRYVEPNHLVHADASPNDPSFGQLWGLHNTGQSVNGVTGTADADVDAREAWDVATGSSSVVVAVIDTGTDFGHPELGGSMDTSPVMWVNPGENCAGCRSDGVDNDGNGYVDDWRGYDFVNNDNNPVDDQAHGTHVSGTIGAVGNNGSGIAGVNWNVKIMALKFLDRNGSGTIADAVEAILYAARSGAHVLNNSWGGGGFSQALFDAIKESDTKGALFVAAAGNDGVNTDSSPHYPSSYDVPNVVSVAATTSSDARASFSNYGRKSVDLGAPGANIYSTVLSNGYDYYNGTSMATPHVAGAAALAKAAFPAATGIGLKALLLRTVDANSGLAGASTSEGRLNANNAVRCAAAPKVWLDSPAAGFVVSVGEAVPVTVIGSNCGEAAGVTVGASANGSAIALTPRGDGLYTGTYAPSQAGAVTISATASVGAAADTRSVSGTAEENYRFEDAPYSWIDATAGGTNTGLNSDDGSLSVMLPFSFTFYKQAFTSVKISSNGYLVFGGSAATAYANADIPATAAPNGLVAPYWDDLNASAGGSIWYRTTGTSPNRKFTVAWVGVPHWSATANPITFQVSLEEGTNDVFFQYRDVNHGNANFDYGLSATVGVENLDGTRGRKFLYKQALLQPYEGAKALRFTNQVGPDTTAPAAPAGLTATAGDGRVMLDWADNTETDLAGYTVHRQGTDSTWSAIATVTTSAYTDTGLVNGTLYTYRVTAHDRATPPNESAPSNEASATPAVDLTPPAAPTGLTAAAGDRQVALDWSNNAEADLAGYRVYRRNTDGSWSTIASTTGSAYTDGGLSNGTTYTYRVTAYDNSPAANESAPSNEASATPSRAPITKDYQPAGYTIVSGTIYFSRGGVDRLYSNDANRLELNAASVSGTYVSEFYARATITSEERATLRRVAVDFDGNTSVSSASLTVRIYNWASGTWETVGGPWTGSTSDRPHSWSDTNAPANYVSATGEMRFSVRGTRSGSFRTRTDWIRFTIEY
jgi:subtilisin family serine protease